MRMTEQELVAYIRQYTELEKECMKSRFPEKFSNEEFWNQRSREKDGYILESRQFMKPEDKIVVTRQDRFNKVRAHKHDYIELCYVWSGICYQTIEGKAVTTEKGDVCIFDTHAVHSIESAGEDDILVNILMRREFLTLLF
jgi:AraC-like ligand binding domain.